MRSPIEVASFQSFSTLNLRLQSSLSSPAIIMFLNLCLFILSFLPSISHSASSPTHYFNISHFLYPYSGPVVEDDLHRRPHHHSFFKGVLKEIADREKWNLEDLRISKLDVKKVKFGAVKRHEFGVRIEKREFVFKLSDQVSRWKRIKRVKNESAFEDLTREMSSNAMLDTFKIQGPFHLRVNGDYELNLALPLNASIAGLKHIYVREGITIEVKGAKEVSFIRSRNAHEKVNRVMSNIGYYQPSLCMAWRPIRIVGSAAVVAYRTWNPGAYIETYFPSKKAVELLPDKCFGKYFYRKRGSFVDALSRRMAFLEKVMQNFVGQKFNRNRGSGSVNAKIIASSLFRFQLEIERKIQSNDTRWSTVADWRTKPTVERVLFEVVARIEGEVLKPLIIKKVKPFIQVDSKAWSNLMSNVSFTNFPSILVPQEALTLDVKW